MDKYFVPVPDITLCIQDITVHVSDIAVPILDINFIEKRLVRTWTMETVRLLDIYI